MAAESTRCKPVIKLTRSDHARLWHLAEIRAQSGTLPWPTSSLPSWSVPGL